MTPREQAQANAQLLAAVQSDDVAKVKNAIAHGADPNARDKDGNPALHLAAAAGRTDAVELLLKHGADIDARDQYGATPLHAAAGLGNAATAQSLIDHGADVGARDRHNSTPLHYAAGKSNADATAVLIENGANVNARNDREETPLHKSLAAAPLTPRAQAARSKTVQALLDNGADLNAVNSLQEKPLGQAKRMKVGKDIEQMIETAVEKSRAAAEPSTDVSGRDTPVEWSEVPSSFRGTPVQVPFVRESNASKAHNLTELADAKGADKAVREERASRLDRNHDGKIDNQEFNEAARSLGNLPESDRNDILAKAQAAVAGTKYEMAPAHTDNKSPPAVGPTNAARGGAGRGE